MSDSEDDRPLISTKAKTPSIVPSKDRTKDEKPSHHIEPGVTLMNGVNGVNGAVNGAQKRKASAGKSYQQSDSDDEPFNKRQRTSAKPGAEDTDDDAPLSRNRRLAIKDESDSDVPLGGRLPADKAEKLQKEKARLESKAEKQGRNSMTNGKKVTQKRKVESDSDDQPIVSKKSASGTKSGKKGTNGVKKEELTDEAPLRKKTSAQKVKAEKSQSNTPVKKGKKQVKEETQEPDDEAEEDEQYRWWEDPTKGDGTRKWETLEHNGVVFPPPYQPLPKNVKMRYDGKPVSLSVEAEEVAGFYGGMLNSTVNVENPTFNKNFFSDFKDIIKRSGGAKGPDGQKIEVLEFEKCDFKPIFEHFEAERAKKKAMTTAEKKALKAEKDEAEAPYQYCLWDGRKQKVGNFRVEPPSLFRGRGEHPKTGKVKSRIMPEQITINIGEKATVPKPPTGHSWKEVKHDHEGTWLAMWQENINGNYKYVMLAASSDVKAQSDHKKFEKARELKKHIGKIRKEYQKNLRHKVMADRQMATAMYLIDQFALRAGNEKGEDEADTVGCCSLKYEHITLEEPDKVIFDFLGKDSIRFHEEFKVDEQVFKNLRIFKKEPKQDGDEIFDRLTTASLNKHLSSYMPGLTAKVFRTYNASATFANLIKELKPGGTITEKVKEYNEANRKVAILCNHRRTVAAGHGAQMEKLQDKIDAVRYQQYRTKRMMLELEPKLKKKRGADYFELPEGLDREWQEAHHKALVEAEREKIQKKFAKDNEKRVAEGEKEMKNKELQERLEVADDLQKKLAKECKKGVVEVEGKGMTLEKLDEKVAKLQNRIDTMITQGEDKKNTSDVALSTSKINYIDPRLTVVFCKRFNCPIEKFFSTSLREKFKWAIESTPEDWEF